MPEWLLSICIGYSLSTPIIVVAILAFLLNLYLNSNSKFARKSGDATATSLEPQKDGKTAYNKRGQTINGVLSVVSLFGILLVFIGC